MPCHAMHDTPAWNAERKNELVYNTHPSHIIRCVGATRKIITMNWLLKHQSLLASPSYPENSQSAPPKLKPGEQMYGEQQKRSSETIQKRVMLLTTSIGKLNIISDRVDTVLHALPATVAIIIPN
ncbi:hypothetical protein BaRGS_00033634 [Batillaria attramentaria]|uniref:Uncharacterized protein n=1 Tax=Batillaria attramentaria TaxID=370345 RepID=A0ABD0JL16_9CAEN